MPTTTKKKSTKKAVKKAVTKKAVTKKAVTKKPVKKAIKLAAKPATKKPATKKPAAKATAKPTAKATGLIEVGSPAPAFSAVNAAGKTARENRVHALNAALGLSQDGKTRLTFTANDYLPEAGAAARIAAHNWRQTALLHPDNALLSKWLHRNLKFLFFFKI